MRVSRKEQERLRVRHRIYRTSTTPSTAYREQNPDASRQRARALVARYQEATSKAPRQGEPWTTEDDEIIMREDLRTVEKALLVGRTYHTVTNRRQKLRYRAGVVGK